MLLVAVIQAVVDVMEILLGVPTDWLICCSPGIDVVSGQVPINSESEVIRCVDMGLLLCWESEGTVMEREIAVEA